MTDAEIINWMQAHMTELREHVTSNTEPSVYTMAWIDSKGVFRQTAGTSLRDCVLGAMCGEHLMVDA